MRPKKIIAASLLFVMAFLMAALIYEECSAAAGGADDVGSDYMQRRGIEGLFKGKFGKRDPRSPDRWQVGLAIGSIFVMIAVVKWL